MARDPKTMMARLIRVQECMNRMRVAAYNAGIAREAGRDVEATERDMRHRHDEAIRAVQTLYTAMQKAARTSAGGADG